MKTPRDTHVYDFNQDSANVAIWNARHGEYRSLTAHLRSGKANIQEMQIAADIIDGKIVRKRGRQPGGDALQRARDIDYFVKLVMSQEGYTKDAAVKAAEDKFKLSKTRVYDALKLASDLQALHDQFVQRVEASDPNDFG
jgi:hypothetical protein